MRVFVSIRILSRGNILTFCHYAVIPGGNHLRSYWGERVCYVRSKI